MNDDASPLSRLVVPARRWWWVLAAAVVVGAALAWITLPSPPGQPTDDEIADPAVTFRATHILMRNEASAERLNYDLVVLLARQGDLVNRVVDGMDEQVDTGDVDAVELEPDPATDTISITATQPTPDLASGLVTTYARELQRLVDDRAEAAIEERIDRAQDRRQELDTRIREIQSELGGLPEDDVDRRLLEAELDDLIDEHAIAQTEIRSLQDQISGLEPQFETLQGPSPVSTSSLEGSILSLPRSPLPRLVVAAILGVIVGTVLVLGIDFLDAQVRTRRDAEDAFGLPVLAELPYLNKQERAQDPVPVLTDPGGQTAEAVRSLRLSLRLAPTWQLSGHAPATTGAVGSMAPVERTHEPRTIVVSSPRAGDGKSTVVANLATSYAEAGESVLIVDCDFRRPTIGPLLGVKTEAGLRDLQRDGEDSVARYMVATRVPRVWLVPAGVPGVAPNWFQLTSGDVVDQASELADVVLFDTGPISLTNEAAALVPAVDAMLLVSRSSRVSHSEARETVEQLARMGAKVAGVVLVGGEGRRRYGYYEVNGHRSHKRLGRRQTVRP